MNRKYFVVKAETESPTETTYTVVRTTRNEDRAELFKTRFNNAALQNGEIYVTYFVYSED